MSTPGQATLDADTTRDTPEEPDTPSVDERAERPSWTPDDAETNGPQCQNCESPVSNDFVRVLGVDGEVHGCIHCMSAAERNGGQR